MAGSQVVGIRTRERVILGAIVLGLVLALVSCIQGKVDERSRAKRADKDGGGTVLVEADRRQCWTFEAYDDRTDAGRLEDGAADDLGVGEERKIEEEATFAADGCGPARLVLPATTIYGAVALVIDDDDDRVHPLRRFALMLWLSRSDVPRGGLIAKPRDGDQYMLYAGDPGSTYRGSDSSPEKIADRPFGNVFDMQFDDGERKALSELGMDADVAGSVFLPRARSVVEGEGDVGTHARRLASLRLTATGANTLRAASRREVTRGADEYSPSSLAETLASIEELESGKFGKVWSRLTPPVRSYLANQQMAALREDLEYVYDGDGYRDAITGSAALDRIDPTQRARWERARQNWTERASALDQEAEDDDYGDGGIGGDGGSIDIPGSLCPTRFC